MNALSMAMDVHAARIHDIVKERRGITADTAEWLARNFGGDAASWLALQCDFEVKTLATRANIKRKVLPREPVPARRRAADFLAGSGTYETVAR